MCQDQNYTRKVVVKKCSHQQCRVEQQCTEDRIILDGQNKRIGNNRGFLARCKIYIKCERKHLEQHIYVLTQVLKQFVKPKLCEVKVQLVRQRYTLCTSKE